MDWTSICRVDKRDQSIYIYMCVCLQHILRSHPGYVMHVCIYGDVTTSLIILFNCIVTLHLHVYFATRIPKLLSIIFVVFYVLLVLV